MYVSPEHGRWGQEGLTQEAMRWIYQSLPLLREEQTLKRIWKIIQEEQGGNTTRFMQFMKEPAGPGQAVAQPPSPVRNPVKQKPKNKTSYVLDPVFRINYVSCNVKVYADLTVPSPSLKIWYPELASRRERYFTLFNIGKVSLSVGPPWTGHGKCKVPAKRPRLIPVHKQMYHP